MDILIVLLIIGIAAVIGLRSKKKRPQMIVVETWAVYGTARKKTSPLLVNMLLLAVVVLIIWIANT